MNNTQRYQLPAWAKSLKLIGALVLVFLFVMPEASAQNTKGDRPSGGSRRESKFKLAPKKKTKQKKSANRVQSKRSSQAGSAKESVPTKIYSQKNPFVNNRSNTTKVQKQNFRESSKRVPARSTSSQTRNVYPQRGPYVNNASPTPESRPPKIKNNSSVKRINSQARTSANSRLYKQRGPYVNNPSRKPNDKPRLANAYPPGYRRVTTPPKDSQQKWRAVSSQRVVVRSATGTTKNTFSQRGPYVNNPSRKPKPTQRIVSNQSQVARLQANPSNKPPGIAGKKAGGGSISRPYISNKSINVFAGFWKQKPKGERPWVQGDLAGKPLRKKNFQTQFPKLVNPTANLVKPKKPRGDRAYSGKAAGSHVSATREQGKKAWIGDVAGRRIRAGKDPGIVTQKVGVSVFPPKKKKPTVGDTPYKGKVPGGGYRSASRSGERVSPRLVGKAPGRGSLGVGSYQGNIKGGRKDFSTRGAGYSGSLKGRRTAKGGGGSVSAGGWNNDGQPLTGTPPLRRNIGFALFSGNKKTRVEPKGGGSVSGGLWNNKNQPLTGKTPSSSYLQAGSFSGNIKSQKPLKGGGSASGKLWNNQNRPLTGKTPSSSYLQAGSFSGNIKASKREYSKDIAGIPKRTRTTRPGMRDQGEEFTGNIRVSKKQPGTEIAGFSPRKYRSTTPGFRDQGEEFTGFIKVSKKEPSKDVAGVTPQKYKATAPAFRDQGEEFTGYIRLPRSQYIRNPYAATTAALRRSKPGATADQYNDLTSQLKQKRYGDRPNAAKGSMPGVVASKSSIKASEYSKVIRQYKYITNPSGTKEALKVREPGKAFANANDYQGNVKMKKFDLFSKRGLHPDAKFVKTNKNNVDEERSMLTNFKLLWAKLFGEEDTQPAHLREKYRKPRYNKDEGSIWYNQHNATPGKSNSLKNAKVAEEQ